MRQVEVEQPARAEKKPKTPEKALQDLMRYAARAERSSGDALRLMRKWGIVEAERRQILEKLQRLHFIDDERFAQAYVREKTQLAGWGIHKIRSGLRLKGIAPAIIEKALAIVAEADDTDATQRLYDLLQRKRRTLKETDLYKIKDKLFRFGVSRGYDYEDVIDTVAAIMKGEGRDE